MEIVVKKIKNFSSAIPIFAQNLSTSNCVTINRRCYGDIPYVKTEAMRNVRRNVVDVVDQLATSRSELDVDEDGAHLLVDRSWGNRVNSYFGRRNLFSATNTLKWYQSLIYT